MEDRQTILEKLRQQSLYARAQALSEQARNRSSLAPIIPSAAGAAGGGGGSDTGCLPPGGLMLTLSSRGGAIKLFLSEVGTANGKTLYANYTVGSERGQEFEGWYVVSWNSKTNLWGWVEIFTETDGYTSELIATSPDLYADVWTMVSEEYPPVGSSQGEEFSCDWRYCVTFSGDGFSLTSSAYASWNEISLTEQPNVYSLGEGGGIFWSPEDSSWVAIPEEDPILLGVTREDLPTGTFDLGGGQTLTINSGICAVEPVPTPEPAPPTPGSTDFIIRIDTTLGDGLDSFTVGADTKTFLYNYDVAWEEVGNPSNSGAAVGYTGSAMISFPSSGQYDISISGLFPAYRASTGSAGSTEAKVVNIIQWGDNQWQSMNAAFNNCQNLNDYSATDTPNLSSVTNMSYMFSEARVFNGDISGWDVSNVTNMDYMFQNAQAFNQDLSGWCVSLILSEPAGFADNTIAWILPKPVWGTCPGVEKVKEPK